MTTDDAALRRAWTGAFVVGEIVGFIPPAVTRATLAALAAPDVVGFLRRTRPVSVVRR